MTAEELLELAGKFRRNNALLTARALGGDSVAESDALELNLLATTGELWQWIRLSEALELGAKGFPIGHIDNLPPRELWAHLA